MRKRSEFFVAKTICSTLYSVFFILIFFREIFALFAKQMEAKFCEKAKIFAFSQENKWKRNFRETIFLFRWKPYMGRGK